MNILASPWNVVFFLGLFAYLSIRGAYARRTRRLEKALRRIDALEQFLLVMVIGGSLIPPLLYLFTPLLNFANYRLPLWAPWCGLIVMLLALWLFWRSHADLGENWSVSLEIRKDHQLVTHGVYRLIRHPMYASIWLWCMAQALLLANWLAGWSSLVPFAVMYFLRTPREEQMMREVFGRQYEDYMAQTGQIFPRFFGRKQALTEK
jgi:protein-S-isoprenylcysteine O-methyltransferase Ste14